jgi:hypothetical protein
MNSTAPTGILAIRVKTAHIRKSIGGHNTNLVPGFMTVNLIPLSDLRLRYTIVSTSLTYSKVKL